jgi:hypothetical protein
LYTISGLKKKNKNKKNFIAKGLLLNYFAKIRENFNFAFKIMCNVFFGLILQCLQYDNSGVYNNLQNTK